MNVCPLKEDHPRIRPRRPDEKEAPASPYIHSTACWRGYVGTWEIRDKRLYLVELRGRLVLDGDGPLFADWVDQMLVVPQGRLVQYVHMGFESQYESELWIKIVGGIETERESIEGGLQSLIDRLLAPKPVIGDLAIVAGPQTGDMLILREGLNTLRRVRGRRLSLETGEPVASLIAFPNGEQFIGPSVSGSSVVRVDGEPILHGAPLRAGSTIEIGEHRCEVRMRRPLTHQS
jgi:hypothetical protein